MSKTKILSLLTVSSAALAAHAETTNDVIVTATRIEQPIEQIGSSVEVITATQIEQSKSSTMLQALELVPGLNIRHSGASSLTASVSLRGAPPAATQIMIDGIPVYDQCAIGTSFDLGSITAANIERIEVLKGAQSVLYGSSAMSGVINIITKKGAEPKASLFAEYGSLNTWRTGASVSGSDSNVNYAVSASFLDRQGESVTDSDTSNDDDGRENKTIQAKVGFTPAAGTEINLFTTYLKARGDYDAGYTTDGSGRYQDQEQILAGAEAKTLLLDGLWEPKLKLSVSDIDRDNINGTSYYGDSWYDSQTVKADLQNSLLISDLHTLILGADWYEDTYKTDSISKGDLDNTGLYGMYQLNLSERWFTTFGARYDDHSIFGGKSTWQVTTAYLLNEEKTSLHASVGTGFKAPTSYQLFAGNNVGNEDLDAQTSTSWDIGIDQQILPNKLKTGVTLFWAEYEDLIGWKYSSDYVTYPYYGYYDNINKMKSSGVETYAEYSPVANLSLKLSYTYTDNDSDDGDYEYFIPNHETDLHVNYAATEKWNVNLNGQHVTETDSSDSYTLVNLASDYQLTEKVQVYSRLTNLLNEDYELSDGYNEDGFGIYGGVKIDL